MLDCDPIDIYTSDRATPVAQSTAVLEKQSEGQTCTLGPLLTVSIDQRGMFRCLRFAVGQEVPTTTDCSRAMALTLN